MLAVAAEVLALGCLSKVPGQPAVAAGRTLPVLMAGAQKQAPRLAERSIPAASRKDLPYQMIPVRVVAAETGTLEATPGLSTGVRAGRGHPLQCTPVGDQVVAVILRPLAFPERDHLWQRTQERGEEEVAAALMNLLLPELVEKDHLSQHTRVKEEVEQDIQVFLQLQVSAGRDHTFQQTREKGEGEEGGLTSLVLSPNPRLPLLPAAANQHDQFHWNFLQTCLPH